MHSNKSRRLSFLSAAAAALWIAGTAAALAAGPTVMLKEPSYRELRRLAERLDLKARLAADQGAHDRSRLYRRDNDFVQAAVDFSRRASQLNERLAGYRARPWNVDDDLRALLRDARDVRDRVRRSRFTDEHVAGDWNEIVGTLDQMMRVSRSPDGQIDFGGSPRPEGGGPPRGVQERDPRGNPPPPPDQHRDEYGERLSPPGPPDSREVAGLARELEDRAGRAHAVAQRVAAQGPYRREFFQSIRDFHDQVVAFRRSVESGVGDRRQIRAEADRLLDSARRTDQSMRQSRAFPEVWPEWQAAIGVLQRIVSRAGA
jgi:hypothetical protein